jgi:hypothetical protein
MTALYQTRAVALGCRLSSNGGNGWRIQPVAVRQRSAHQRPLGELV